MRTTRWLPITAVCLLLAAALPSAIAQDEDLAPVTFVTGTTVRQVDHIEVPGWDERGDGGPGQVRGYEVLLPAANGGGSLVEQDIEWSDPRLPSKHWFLLDYHLIMKSPEGANSIVTSHLLADEAGSWTGTGRAVRASRDRYSLYVLTGHGAYEGLYAIIQGTPGAAAHGPWDWSYQGYIFEGQLPPFPDPPEPVTTEGMQSYPFPLESPATDTSEATVAPVATVPAGPAAVTGEAGDLQGLEMGTSTKLDGRIRTIDDALRFDQTATDPRLAGTWTQSMVSDDLASSAEGRLFLYAGTALLENGEGYWLGSLTGYQAADEPFPGLQQSRLTGHGAYEGQSALVYHQGEGGFDTLEGLVFDGEFPPEPEPIEPPAD